MRGDIALVERRERSAPDDVRATVLVQMVNVLLRMSIEARLASPSGGSVRDILDRHLDAARQVFSP